MRCDSSVMKIYPSFVRVNRDLLRVSTINACTGIESPIVMIIGLYRLFEQEKALGLDDTDREELIRKNTKRVFVALTRASQKLVVIYKNEATRGILLAHCLAICDIG